MYFYGMSEKEIREAREAYFVAHSKEREEYDKMVVTTGTGALGIRNKSKVGPNICRHKLYGCIGGGDKTTHKTERSKSCTFNGKSAEYIRTVRDEYFVKNPHVKVEYDKMYPEVVTVGNGKRRRRRRKQRRIWAEGIQVCEHVFVNICVDTLSFCRLGWELF